MSTGERLSEAAYYPPPAELPWALRALAENARALYSLSLTGAPVARRMFAYLTDVQPGDVVLETSRPLRVGEPLDGLGRLLFIAGRKPRTEGEWGEAEAEGRWKMDSKRGHGPYHYIDPLDGSQRKCWDNATFIRVSPKLMELLRTLPAGELESAT